MPPTVKGVISKGASGAQLDVFETNGQDVAALDTRLVAIAITFSKPVVINATVRSTAQHDDKQSMSIAHKKHPCLTRMVVLIC